MIIAKINGQILDSEYYTGLNTSYDLFGEIFKLGSKASNSFNFSILKQGYTPQLNDKNFTLENENGDLLAVLRIDNIDEDESEYKLSLTDIMIDLEFEYDASQIFVDGKTTLLQIVQDICQKANLELATTNFRGANKEISWYDNTRTARTYIGYVAELNGGFARINKQGQLEFVKQKTAVKKTIYDYECEKIYIGEKHLITRVVYEIGSLKYEFGNENGNTLYLNTENVFITERSEVEEIYNDIKDFEFYNLTIENNPIYFDEIMAGDILNLNYNGENYNFIANYNDIKYNRNWIGGYYCQVATKRQESTQIVGIEKQVKNLTIEVDRDKNTIRQTVELVNNLDAKTTTLEQTVNSIDAEVKDVIDVEKSATGITEVHLTNTIASNNSIGRIEIRPTATTLGAWIGFLQISAYSKSTYDFYKELKNVFVNMGFSYEDDIIYIYNNFTVDKYNENVEYKKGDIAQDDEKNIYFCNSDCQNIPLNNINYWLPTNLKAENKPVIRIQWRQNSITALENPDNEYLYTFSNDTYMAVDTNQALQFTVKYVKENLYTKMFATKTDLNLTEKNITQYVTANYDDHNTIEAKLELKVDTDKLISEINESADIIHLTSNRLIVESTYFSIDEDGKITATGGKVGGFEITQNSLENDLNIPYEFKTEDLEMIKKITFGADVYNPIYNTIYDVDNDGRVTSEYTVIDKPDVTDFDIVQNIINGTDTTTKKFVKGKFKLDTSNFTETILIEDENKTAQTIIGLLRTKMPELFTNILNVIPYNENFGRKLEVNIEPLLSHFYLNFVGNFAEFCLNAENTTGLRIEDDIYAHPLITGYSDVEFKKNLNVIGNVTSKNITTMNSDISQAKTNIQNLQAVSMRTLTVTYVATAGKVVFTIKNCHLDQGFTQFAWRSQTEKIGGVAILNVGYDVSLISNKTHNPRSCNADCCREYYRRNYSNISKFWFKSK